MPKEPPIPSPINDALDAWANKVWQEDQGTGPRVSKAIREWKAARARLVTYLRRHGIMKRRKKQCSAG